MGRCEFEGLEVIEVSGGRWDPGLWLEMRMWETLLLVVETMYAGERREGPGTSPRGHSAGRLGRAEKPQ